MHRSLLALTAALIPLAPAAADEGNPVAVRWWGQSFVTVESYWGITVAIDPYSLDIGYDNPHVEADFVVMTHEHADHSNETLVRGDPVIEHALAANGNVRTIGPILDRSPNSPNIHIGSIAQCVFPSSNAVYVQTIASHHDDEQGAKRGNNALVLVSVDAVRILHCGDLGQSSLTDTQLEAIGDVDVLVIPVGGVYTIDGPTAAAITEQVNPRFVLPIHYKTDVLKIDLQPIDPFLAALPDRFEESRPVGNTFAVTAGRGPTREAPKVVIPKYTEWQMPQDLARLFAIKETDARKNMAVYKPLTANQLNHKPANGTHTPRWNVEHTTGVELLFLSSVYNAIDPSVPVIRLTPAQMPPDYEPAHPDWDGAEEARTIERAQAFTRRFAYLLDGLPMDELPQGAPQFARSLSGLFDLMINHYTEHTDHVKEKFLLPDWPDQ